MLWGRVQVIQDSITLGAGMGMDGHVLELKSWNETLRTGGDQEVGESQMKP